MTTETLTLAVTFEAEISRLFGDASDAPRAATAEDRDILADQHPEFLDRSRSSGLVIIVSATDAGYAAWGIHPGRIDDTARGLAELPDDAMESDPFGEFPWDVLDRFATRATRS